jgi:hypothetical protein
VLQKATSGSLTGYAKRSRKKSQAQLIALEHGVPNYKLFLERVRPEHHHREALQHPLIHYF